MVLPQNSRKPKDLKGPSQPLGRVRMAPAIVPHRAFCAVVLLRIHRVCAELVRQGTCDILSPLVHKRLTGVLYSAGVVPAAAYTLNSAFIRIDSLIQQQEHFFFRTKSESMGGKV